MRRRPLSLARTPRARSRWPDPHPHAAGAPHGAACRRPGARERMALFTPALEGFAHSIHASEEAQLLFNQARQSRPLPAPPAQPAALPSGQGP